MIVLPQHESDDLVVTAVDRLKSPVLIGVIEASHTQALAQMKRDSGHKQDDRPGLDQKAARLHTSKVKRKYFTCFVLR